MEVTGSRVCRLPNPNMIVAQQNLRLVRKLARPPSDPRADSLDLNRPREDDISPRSARQISGILERARERIYRLALDNGQINSAV